MYPSPFYRIICHTGNSRWIAIHTIHQEGDQKKVYARAQQTGYYFNIEKHRPVPFPDFLIQRFMVKDKKDKQVK